MQLVVEEEYVLRSMDSACRAKLVCFLSSGVWWFVWGQATLRQRTPGVNIPVSHHEPTGPQQLSLSH